MKYGRMRSGNEKHLVGVLAGLGVVIVGLVVVIVVVNTKRNDDIRDELEQGIEESYIRDDQKLTARVLGIKEEAKKILKAKPVDFDKFDELFDSGIEMALEMNRIDYVPVLTNDRYDLLMGAGYKKEALEALKKGDYDVLSEPDRYRLYEKIIELAKELGDDNILSEYSSKQENVAGAYWADYHAHEKSLNEDELRSEMDSADDELIEDDDGSDDEFDDESVNKDKEDNE